MKKRMIVFFTVAVLTVSGMTACGRKAENVSADQNVNASEENKSNEDNSTQVTEPVEDAADAVDANAEEAEETEQEEPGMEKEYTLQFYQYGEFLDTVGLRMTDTEFILLDQETGEIQEEYSYTVLTDSLIALYVEDAKAYTICYYKISGFDYTLNILGATAESLVGSWNVYYTDQASTADIEFMPDGTAIESNQTSADGMKADSPYEFHYCWYAPDDTALFLFVCLDNGYYAYSVELAEDGTLNLTENGAYTYDL